MAALTQLKNPATWQGSHDEILLAIDRATDLQFLLQSQVAPSSDVQAPFWQDDSGDDADDTLPVDEQDWYGAWDGESFTETLAYAFLTNFLSSLITPQGAIKFLAIPRAFRVAIRKNPHGANLLAFLDGGLYKVINGYSPVDQVVEFLFASPGTELLLVHDGTHDPDATPDENGNYTCDIIRGRLSAEDVTPSNVRWTGDPPAYQVLDSDGVTWVDQPSADPRYSPSSFFPPLAHYSGIECDTAARMTAQLKESITLMSTVADAAQAVTGLLELIVLPTGLTGLLFDLFFTICNFIIDEGQSTVAAAFTDAVYDDIQCTLSCAIGSDGQITQENLDAAWEQIKAAHTGTVATVIDEVRFLFTDAVFSNAGVKRTETGDCTGCECEFCHYIDLRLSNGSSEGVTIQGGTWVSGSGIQGANFGANDRSDAFGYWAFSETLHVVQIEIIYTKTAGGGANNVNHFNALYPTATGYGTTLYTHDDTNTLGSHLTKSIAVNHDLAGMGWDINSGSNTTPLFVEGLIVSYKRTSALYSENCP